MNQWRICHKSGRVLFTTTDERTAINRAELGWRVEKVDQSREQFEAYYADKFGATLQWVIDRRSDSKDFVGYQIGPGIQPAWEMWKASRKQMVINLIPDINPLMFNDDVIFGYQKAKNEVIEVLTAAGIRVKSD